MTRSTSRHHADFTGVFISSGNGKCARRDTLARVHSITTTAWVGDGHVIRGPFTAHGRDGRPIHAHHRTREPRPPRLHVTVCLCVQTVDGQQQLRAQRNASDRQVAAGISAMSLWAEHKHARDYIDMYATGMWTRHSMHVMIAMHTPTTDTCTPGRAGCEGGGARPGRPGGGGALRPAPRTHMSTHTHNKPIHIRTLAHTHIGTQARTHVHTHAITHIHLAHMCKSSMFERDAAHNHGAYKGTLAPSQTRSGDAPCVTPGRAGAADDRGSTRILFST